MPPELLEQIAAHARGVVIRRPARPPPAARPPVRGRPAGAAGHAHRHRVIQPDDGRPRDGHERGVQIGNPRPVGLLRHRGSRMTGGDRRLQLIGPWLCRERIGSAQGRQSAADQQPVPARPILIQQAAPVRRSGPLARGGATTAAPSVPPGRAPRPPRPPAPPRHGPDAGPRRTAMAAPNPRPPSPSSPR